MSLEDIKTHLSRIEIKLDKIDDKQTIQADKLSSMDVTIAKQEKEISIHIEGVRTLKTELDQQRAEIKPIKDHVIFMQSSWKLLLAVGSVLAIVLTLKQIWPH